MMIHPDVDGQGLRYSKGPVLMDRWSKDRVLAAIWFAELVLAVGLVLADLRSTVLVLADRLGHSVAFWQRKQSDSCRYSNTDS